MFTQKKYKVFTGIVMSLLLMDSLSASRLQLVNENKKELAIKIKADGNELKEKYTTIYKKIAANESLTVVINKDDINGRSYYSIKGDTNAFTFGGKCDALNVNKNYKITFLDDIEGTTCRADEVE